MDQSPQKPVASATGLAATVSGEDGRTSLEVDDRDARQMLFSIDAKLGRILEYIELFMNDIERR